MRYHLQQQIVRLRSRRTPRYIPLYFRFAFGSPSQLRPGTSPMFLHCGHSFSIYRVLDRFSFAFHSSPGEVIVSGSPSGRVRLTRTYKMEWRSFGFQYRGDTVRARISHRAVAPGNRKEVFTKKRLYLSCPSALGYCKDNILSANVSEHF